MQDFVFHNTTKVFFGRDQFCHLGEEAARFGKRGLLVYGGGSIKKTGLYDRIMGELDRAGLEVFELPGVEPNPRHTTVNRGAALCKREGIDLILAVGGGSVLDCGKAVSLAACYDGSDCWDLISKKAPAGENLPLIAVLTLAATGSEMNRVAVISNWERQEKKSISTPTLGPAVSFLDPTNTFTVGKYQTASGSADIISHVFDRAYFSSQAQMDMLVRLQEQVMRTVVDFAPVALREPENYEARANLMWASTWALNGFLYDGVSQDSVCHKLEHPLSACYDVTHGHGLAILIPRWLRYILNETTAPRIKRMGLALFDTDPALPLLAGAEAAIEALEGFFFQDLGLASRLSDLGLDDSRFQEMAGKACGDKGRVHGITDLTPADVEAIYRMSL